MNPRNTFYRDSRALAYGTRRSRFASPLLHFSPSVSSSSFFLSLPPPLPPSFIVPFLFCSFLKKEPRERERREDPLPVTIFGVPEFARIRWRSMPRNDERSECRGSRRNGPRADDIFSLDGSDTASRVYTRELDATSRRDSGCRPVHAQAPKRHLNYRLRLFMSRHTVAPRYSHSRYLLLVLCFGEPR